jgi:uncharacterized protein
MPATQHDPARSFLGVGWAFPPVVSANGSLSTATYEEDVRQSILIILRTEPGERVMRPNFGAGLGRFVFEPVNPTTIAQVHTAVEDALIAWEARIDVLEVKVETDAAERNVLLIDITYRLRATNAVGNLVYPFYLQEGTPT